MEKIATHVERQYQKLLKITGLVSFIILIVIFWDINALGASASFTYFVSKLAFLVVPILIITAYRHNDILRPYMQPAFALNLFAYSAYYMSTVHYSYYTAFIQLFVGLVLYLKFSVKSFLTTYFIALLLVFYGVNSLKAQFGIVEFVQRSSDILSAVIPMYILSILIFFVLKRAEEKEEAKTDFFKNLGENVGFLLHEIKQPLLAIESEVSHGKIDEIHELLQVSNIMWPNQIEEVIPTRDFETGELLKDILQIYDKDIKDLNINLIFEVDSFVINQNKQIIRIILKNLIKNAIEANVGNNIKNKYIKIKSDNKSSLSIENSITKNLKIDVKKIFTAGFSQKSNLTNKGMGLFITSQLAKKTNNSVNASQRKDSFQINLKLNVKNN